jgi:hypothetical protein
MNQTIKTASVKQLISSSMSGSDIVVATGCPNSRWELIVPVLDAAGLTVFDASLSGWYEDLFQSADNEQNFTANSIQPDAVAIDKATLSEKSNTSKLLVDNRNLLLLDFWANYLTDARFLLFYTRAETAVAHNLLQGNETPQEIMESWQTANRHLIRFQRRHRDRAILLDAEIATQETQALVGACSLINLKLKSHELSEQPSNLPTIERFVAHHLVKNQPSLSALQVELEARAQPLSKNFHSKDFQSDKLIDFYLQQKFSAESQEQQLTQNRWEIKNLKDENELLLFQVLQVQEELEHYYLKFNDQKASTEKITADLNNQTKVAAERFIQIEQLTKDKLDVEEKKSFLTKAYDKLKLNKEITKQFRLIKKSSFFDESWYLAQYLDVAKAKADPIMHYLKYGAKEMRNPSSRFNTHFYLQSNLDVKYNSINPLVHYIRHGQKEGRKPM